MAVKTVRRTYWPSMLRVLPPEFGPRRHLWIRVTDRTTWAFEVRRARLRTLKYGKRISPCPGSPILRGNSATFGYVWDVLRKLGFVLHLEQPERPAW